MTTVTESIRRYPGVAAELAGHTTSAPLDHVPVIPRRSAIVPALKPVAVIAAIIAVAIYVPQLIFVAIAAYFAWAVISVVRTGWPV